MARVLGPDAGSAYVVDSRTGNPATGKTGTFYTDSAGTILADIAAYQPDNPTVPGSSISTAKSTTDNEGNLRFWFPDGINKLYVQWKTGGKLYPVTADHQTEIDALSGRMSTAEQNITTNASSIAALTNRLTTDEQNIAANASTASGALQKNQNLADLPSVGTARANLQLGTAATKDVGTGSANVASSRHASEHAPGGTDPLANLTQANFAAANIDGAVSTPSLRTLGAGAQQAAAGATVQSLLAEDPTSTVRLQSGYSRSAINAGAGSGMTVGAVALCTDPAVSGRIWAQGLDFGQLCRSDNDFVTGVAQGAPPAGTSAGVFHLEINNGFMWMLQGPSAAASGSLWRSPAPSAAGTGISWTKVFDLASPPAGITVGDQATFRNASVAISGTNVYLLEYSVATITGGPSLYYSSDSGATWVKRWTWANAKHGHAVRVISGVPWVSLGDSGSTFSDIGLWCATSAAATSFSRKSVYGEASGGNTWYIINMMQVAMGNPAVNMILGEYDGLLNYGPICYPSNSISSAKAFLPTTRLPPSLMGTMRQMTLDLNGNMWWVHTGENAAVGPYDSVCVARGPWFDRVIVVESLASAGAPFQSIGNAVVNPATGVLYLGKFKITPAKFVGQ